MCVRLICIFIAWCLEVFFLARAHVFHGSLVIAAHDFYRIPVYGP